LYIPAEYFKIAVFIRRANAQLAFRVALALYNLHQGFQFTAKSRIFLTDTCGKLPASTLVGVMGYGKYIAWMLAAHAELPPE